MDNVDENYFGLRHIWLCEYCRTYCWQIISTVSQVRLPMAIGPGSHTSGIETYLPSYLYKRSFSKKGSKYNENALQTAEPNIFLSKYLNSFNYAEGCNSFETKFMWSQIKTHFPTVVL